MNTIMIAPCVICGEFAPMTTVGILLCQKHLKEYLDEAEEYMKNGAKGPFSPKLLEGVNTWT